MNRADWEITPEKFLNKDELAALMIRADELKVIGEARDRPQLIRDWMIINTFIFTGVRRFEACKVKCVDFKIFGGNSYLIVTGKGGKTRHVHLPKGYKKNVAWYMRWKAARGEITDAEAFFLRTERSPKYSPSGIYKRWKKYCPNHRLHDARHTQGAEHSHDALPGRQVGLEHTLSAYLPCIAAPPAQRRHERGQDPERRHQKNHERGHQVLLMSPKPSSQVDGHGDLTGNL